MLEPASASGLTYLAASVPVLISAAEAAAGMSAVLATVPAPTP